ncbi:O-antigen/teichoic acid export membrane protein [Marmoricola sp. OAE513]|uniref:lipopolysaccharide biosynthesis protein n=1 Tax=Marmoricola sp. OAE513 TaxID=2817894 RepID=UPI001AE67921
MTAGPEKSTRRTVLSAVWMFGGRGLGLLWALLLTHELGISGYGQFVVGISAAALISIPVDAYYLVRSPRVDDEQFEVDRASRYWLGVLIFALGLGLFAVWLPAGLALSKAGGDVFFNAQKSTAIRTGRPDNAFALDSARQGLSLVAGMVVIVAVEDASVWLLSLVYVLGFVPFAVAMLPRVVGVRVELPERTRSTVALVAEALGGAAYTQGDIVLLGLIAGESAAGYYSYATLALWSIAAVGQNYSFTFHEPLREHGGAVEAGPPFKITSALAVAGGAGMIGTGVVLWLLGTDNDLWLAFVVLSVAASTRFYGAVFTTVLALQSRDELRARMSLVAVAIKTAGILALAWSLGSIGAAIAFVLADLVAFAWAYRALYAARSEVAV